LGNFPRFFWVLGGNFPNRVLLDCLKKKALIFVDFSKYRFVSIFIAPIKKYFFQKLLLIG
jgi:hypothetical protein